MSNEITIITPKSLDEARGLATTISKASLLPEALRGKEADVLMTIMTGAELGLGPMQSIRAIDVIKGKPTLKAEAMVALVRRRRDVCEYLVIRRTDATACTIETKRVGDPVATTMSFTIDDAKAAGLLSNDNWKRFPSAMLRARCSSAICKAVYSDLVLGLYDAEELDPARPSDEPRDVTPPRASPPVIESTATVMDSKATEGRARGNLLDLVLAANTVEQLNALVPQMQALKMQPADPLRLRWGARRDELTKRDASAAPPESYMPPRIESEEVPA